MIADAEIGQSEHGYFSGIKAAVGQLENWDSAGRELARCCQAANARFPGDFSDGQELTRFRTSITAGSVPIESSVYCNI